MESNLLLGEHVIMPFQDKPFNGDTFMCEKFIELKKKFNINAAVELGAAVGGTTKWLCENFERVYAIELNPAYRNVCLQRIAKFENVNCLLGSTVEELPKVLNYIGDNTIFHIDSHWGGNNPLLEELELITKKGLKPVLEIHDFKVPGNDGLGYDVYGNISYEWNWIKNSIEKMYGPDGYIVEYNSMAVGAKRGAIYIYSK